jgi:hypothetical protein
VVCLILNMLIKIIKLVPVLYWCQLFYLL